MVNMTFLIKVRLSGILLAQLQNIFSSSYLCSASVQACVTRNIATLPSPDVVGKGDPRKAIVKQGKQFADLRVSLFFTEIRNHLLSLK